MFGRGFHPSTEFDFNLYYYIMEKKNIWVVTNVVIGRVTLSVNTYALRWFDNLDDAKSFLENECKRLCKIGYEPSKFAHFDWGWSYESDYTITQVAISLALGD